MPQHPDGSWTIERLDKSFDRIMRTMPPELKEFVASLRGLPEEEANRLIDEKIAALDETNATIQGTAA